MLSRFNFSSVLRAALSVDWEHGEQWEQGEQGEGKWQEQRDGDIRLVDGTHTIPITFRDHLAVHLYRLHVICILIAWNISRTADLTWRLKKNAVSWLWTIAWICHIEAYSVCFKHWAQFCLKHCLAFLCKTASKLQHGLWWLAGCLFRLFKVRYIGLYFTTQ